MHTCLEFTKQLTWKISIIYEGKRERKFDGNLSNEITYRKCVVWFLEALHDEYDTFVESHHFTFILLHMILLKAYKSRIMLTK